MLALLLLAFAATGVLLGRVQLLILPCWHMARLLRRFAGGKLNVSVNCIDRHLTTRGDQVWKRSFSLRKGIREMPLR